MRQANDIYVMPRILFRFRYVTSAMGPRPKQPVVICPRCRRRMATKEHKPFGPKARKAIKFTDSLVEVAYVCESCGTEIKRTLREQRA